jgi:hypothetical protein
MQENSIIANGIKNIHFLDTCFSTKFSKGTIKWMTQ